MKITDCDHKLVSGHFHPRVWEIDALRGLLILGVLAVHLYYTVDAFCIRGGYNIDPYAYISVTDPLHFWFDWDENGVIFRSFLTETLRNIWFLSGVNAFFIISGISCQFSRGGVERGLKLLIAAFIVSGFTKLLAVWTDNPARFIRFGVLHCYGYCHVLYHFLLKKHSNKTLLLIALPIFIVGYYLRYHPAYSEYALLYPFGIREKNAVTSAYWPIFPMLGWLLVGVVFGRKVYSSKKTLLPYPFLMRLTRPLQWLGRYSGQIYLAHIFIYTTVFVGIGWIFGLL